MNRQKSAPFFTYPILLWIGLFLACHATPPAHNAGSLSAPMPAACQAPGPRNPVKPMLSCSEESSLSLRADGTVWTWGSNNNGKPSQIIELQDIIAVDACHGLYSHGLAVKKDGTVWAWGNNRYGQLGDGTQENRRNPVQVKNLTDVIAAAGGYDNSFALKQDGTVWAWGSNINGEAGTVSLLPLKVEGLTDITAIASGGDHCLALKRDGTVWAWGNNSRGQLGDGTLVGKSIPAPVPGLSQVTLIGAGCNSSFASRSDGSAWAWGANDYGQTGNSGTVNRLTPVRIPGLNNVAAFSSKGFITTRTLALTADGRVWTWGMKIGAAKHTEATPEAIQKPAPISSLPKIIAIGAGDDHYLALDEHGCLWAWGYNPRGQFGDGLAPFVYSPRPVPGTQDEVALACGKEHSLALHQDGSVWSWGNLRVRPAPFGDCHPDEDFTATINASPSKELVFPTGSPAKVEGLSDITAIAAGSWHNLALKADGTVWAWGANYCGQLGIGKKPGIPKPVPVPGLDHIMAIAAGDRHSLALRRDGTVFVWGCAGRGQLGINKLNHYWTPTRIPDFQEVVALASRHETSAAVKRDGSVWTWGYNHWKVQCTPTLVQGLTGVLAVAPGGSHILALKHDGTVWGWGWGNRGQLGDGVSEFSHTPVLVANLQGATVIAAGKEFSCAIRADGSFWFWGMNLFRQPEDHQGPYFFTTPIQVPALEGSTAVCTGYAHLMMLKNDRSRYVWGCDHTGQLGQGRPPHSVFPRLVQGGALNQKLLSAK